MSFLKTLITFNFIAGLFVLFVPVYASDIPLNQKEQNYLANQSELSLCVDPDWLPYEQLDAQGNYSGLVSRYMLLLQSKLLVILKPKMTRSWNETQKQYESGQCNLVSALNKTTEREKYLDFTQVYIQSPAVLILPEGNEKDSKLADLSGKSLAMVKGYVYESKLRKQYPSINIVYSTNMNEAIAMVSQGKADATIGPMYLIFSAMMKLNISNLKMLGNAEYQDELRIGIRKGDFTLLSIMNKALNSITEDDHRKMRKSGLHGG
jgi:ABC-type amino acid transport substrate-binding protein